ncbi:cuticle protein 7-like [Oratosquilla oratoria]|uniref:cuticle protein 7-like n=1 Tax=Oratosquilla oratoria TaxID=337810 RepID=UPI003F757DF0
MLQYKAEDPAHPYIISTTAITATTMRSLILLALALCCHAAPQFPLVYSGASGPMGWTPGFNSFAPFVGGAWPFMGAPVTFPRYASAQVPAVPALPMGLTAMQYRSQDELGNVAFNHAGGPSSRSEFRTPFGAQVGSFSYIDGAGKVQHRTYVADAFGTRMTGTDLPEAPEYTPEVAKARSQHLALRAKEVQAKTAAAEPSQPAAATAESAEPAVTTA